MNDFCPYEPIIDELSSSNPKKVGIGSGSTIKTFLQLFNAEMKAKHVWIPTSHDTKLFMENLGGFTIISDLISHPRLDLVIDGFDHIINNNIAIKGKGGCLTWEKMVASSGNELFLIGAASKLDLKSNETVSIPLEILPMGLNLVQEQLQATLGLKGILRMQKEGKIGPVVTDFGNWLIDLQNVPIERITVEFCSSLKLMTGVVEHGLFTLPFELVIIDNK